MKRLFVMDGHSHLFRAYHAVGYLSTSKGVPSHAVLILSTMLWKLIREEQPDYLAIAWDPPGPTFRDALSADYKATRSAMPDDLVRQLPYVRRLFEALRTPVLEFPGFEADDVLATVVDKALATPELEIVVVSGDKDLLQLVHGHRHPEVRRFTTTAALSGLARAGALDPVVASGLVERYRFLRRVSAALRLLGARPSDTLELAGPMPARVASAIGLESRQTFLEAYREHTTAVRATYSEHLP